MTGPSRGKVVARAMEKWTLAEFTPGKLGHSK